MRVELVEVKKIEFKYGRHFHNSFLSYSDFNLTQYSCDTPTPTSVKVIGKGFAICKAAVSKILSYDLPVSISATSSSVQEREAGKKSSWLERGCRLL